MDIQQTIQILETLASGYSPLTGESVGNESVLNERNVIRALQIAIDQLKKQAPETKGDVVINEEDIEAVIELFKERKKNPTSHSLTGFFLGTRRFRNLGLVSNKLYGKLKGLYTKGQLFDFFSQYLVEKGVITNEVVGSESYRKTDFFEKAIFNRLTENGISQLKGKINDIGVLKTEDLTEYVLEARKVHPRAYEKWSAKETELLAKAIKYTNDLDILSACFQRGKKSIESAAEKIILESLNPDTQYHPHTKL